MRSTILAARVLAAVLLLWTGLVVFWTVKIFEHKTWWIDPNRGVLTDEVLFLHFTVPLISVGGAIGLLLLASILDELRRHPE
jgi:hypothetical protein